MTARENCPRRLVSVFFSFFFFFFFFRFHTTPCNIYHYTNAGPSENLLLDVNISPHCLPMIFWRKKNLIFFVGKQNFFQLFDLGFFFWFSGPHKCCFFLVEIPFLFLLTNNFLRQQLKPHPSYSFPTLLLLIPYCFPTVFILFFYCFPTVSPFFPILFLLFYHCFPAVFKLFFRCSEFGVGGGTLCPPRLFMYNNFM